MDVLRLPCMLLVNEIFDTSQCSAVTCFSRWES